MEGSGDEEGIEGKEWDFSGNVFNIVTLIIPSPPLD